MSRPRIDFCVMSSGYGVLPGIKANLSVLGNDVEDLTSFIQRMVYVVSVKYLRERIQSEILSAFRSSGRSYWLSEVFLYRALGGFNSEIDDTHLFDKNDLRRLKEALNEYLFGEKDIATFRLRILGRYFSIRYEADCFTFCFHEHKVESPESTKVDEPLQRCLVQFFEEENNRRSVGWK